VAGHCGGARQVERRRMVRGCLGVWNEGKWAGARERERGEPGSGSAGSAVARGRRGAGAWGLVERKRMERERVGRERVGREKGAASMERERGEKEKR
jgi:hypothetical protein